jgi:anaerobic magnesium-protoporphyrin IX monomethyl ester cyclase
MIDVLLTHSYFVRFDPKQKSAHTPYPPLGTMYAAAILRKAGFSVQVFDTMLADAEEELLPALARWQPRILAIYDDDFNYLTKMCLSRMREAAFTLAGLAKQQGCLVLVHGSDSADNAELYLRNSADAVLIGESEQTLSEACALILQGKPEHLSALPGMATIDGDKVFRTPRRVVTKDLDALPFPAWDLVDLSRYRDIWRQHHGRFSLNMVTTRGCPFHCNWCAKPIYGQVYNSRSPENVADELVMLVRDYGVEHIWFADDIFGLKPGWVQRLSTLLQERQVHVRFKIQARADLLLEHDTIPALAAAGCEEAWIGAESGSQRILDAMEKGITVAQIYETRRRLTASGIRAGFFLQFGYSGEKHEDILSTLRMIKELMPEDIGVSISYPLPGTRFYENVRTEMSRKRNWVDSDDLSMMFAGEFSSPYYRALHRYVHRTFRMRQGLRYLRETAGGNLTLTPTVLRRIAAIAPNAAIALFRKIQTVRLARA